MRSIKEEGLSRVVPLGEGHLRRLVREYVRTTIGSETTRDATISCLSERRPSV